jgi:hypothetical protein
MAIDVPTPVQRLLDAANDIDAFLSAFTADGVVDDWGREPFRLRRRGRARGADDDPGLGVGGVRRGRS